MSDPIPFSETEMLALSGRAIAKIDRRGRRGTEAVTFDEIEAMAALIDITGTGHLCRRAAEDTAYLHPGETS